MDALANAPGAAPLPCEEPAAGEAQKGLDLPVALFCGADILLPESSDRRTGGLPVFAPAAPPVLIEPSSFKFGAGTYAATELGEPEIAAAGLGPVERMNLRTYIGAVPESTASFALKARAYAHWASVSRFCSSCGSPLRRGSGPEGEGGKVCVACGKVFFPRISPAIIVLISKGDEILLAHNVKFAPGRHGLIAGFVEPGETLEETLRREVMEEAGIEVGEPRYVRSQPWPFPDSLMLGFEAEWLSGEARPDGVEIDHLGWFSLDRLPDIPPPGSVARFLIERFADKNRPPPCAGP